MSQI
jgi:hypothetical protein